MPASTWLRRLLRAKLVATPTATELPLPVMDTETAAATTSA
jgi:hypothetical protein